MKVAVVLGGASAERDISLASGAQVLQALQSKGHKVIAVDTAHGLLSSDACEQLIHTTIQTAPPSSEELARLSQQTAQVLSHTKELSEVDVAFLTLHGGAGEDGTIQAFLDTMQIPYTGSEHKGSALAMDKDISKQLFTHAGVPTAPWMMAPTTRDTIASKFSYPVVVKANKQGSSVGLYIVQTWEELEKSIEKTFQFDDEVMIEQFIAGRELTVGILGDEPLSVGEIFPLGSDVFDYQSKYQADGAREVFPADLSTELTYKAQSLALKAHRALKLRDYSRVDFRLDANNQFWCLEVNTLPGMTSRSLLPQSAAVSGYSFPDFCEKICLMALERKNT
ncbi:MAG: D-alanine--D-alanine ligase [Verrucomicrobiota bacterium]